MEELNDRDRQLYFQKVKKRMLRSKVKSVLETEVDLFCLKHARKNQSIETIEQKHKLFDQERYEEILRKTNFPRRNFSFQKIIQPMQNVLSSGTPRSRLMAAVSKLIRQLTKEQIQEITEDPGYFFQTDKLAKYEFLRDPLFWKPTEYILYFQKKNRRKKQLQPINSESRLLQPIKLNVIEQSDFNLESLQQSIIEEKQLQIENKNQMRRDNFIENQKKQLVKDNRSLQAQSYLLKIELQVQQANQRLDQIKSQVENTKDQQRLEAMEQAQQIRQNLRRIREEQDLQYMNTLLRRVCIEKQVKSNQINAMRQKIDKVRLLGKKVEKKEEKEDSEENY